MSEELQSLNNDMAESEGNVFNLHISTPLTPSPAINNYKTCLWCDKGQDCAYYHKVIAKEASKLLGQEQTELRQYIASVCPEYKQEEQRFFTYSNGEPYYG